MNFTKILTDMFETVEPAFRANQVNQYRALAIGQCKFWIEAILALEGLEQAECYRQFHRLGHLEFVRFTTPTLTHSPAAYIQAAKAGVFAPAYEKSERAANDTVDYAKCHFIGKQTKKLSNATKNCTAEPEVESSLSFNGVVTGFLRLIYPDAGFTVMMSIITNYRHERGFTSFHQFPARFTNATMHGKPVTARLSEAWMSENFRG